MWLLWEGQYKRRSWRVLGYVTQCNECLLWTWNINEAYVQYWDGTVVSGKEVIEIMEQGIEKMNNLLMKTKAWAKVRNLDTADPNKQMLKLIEEVGELAQGMAKNDLDLIVDAIGDVQVVLVILAEQLGLSVEDCWSIAYDEIKDRK